MTALGEFLESLVLDGDDPQANWDEKYDGDLNLSVPPIDNDDILLEDADLEVPDES